jgi:hypothetical protein
LPAKPRNYRSLQMIILIDDHRPRPGNNVTTLQAALPSGN